MSDRQLRFQRKMTDAEAMLWTVEKDPRLSSNIGTVTILDQPIDVDAFRRRMATAVANIPRMRERVAPVLGRLTPPVWEPDPDFDLDFHLRRTALPSPGSERQLLDLAATMLQEPFDRTRPLWVFVAIEGLAGGRGALITKLHHTITDGEGGVRLAEHYMEAERDAPAPEEVDLQALIAQERTEAQQAPGVVDGFLPAVLRTAGHARRRGLGIARRGIGELTRATDPRYAIESAQSIRDAVSSAVDQLSPDRPGSPIWTVRSRRRVLDVLDVPFASAKDAAGSLGGTLNDLFVTAAATAAVSYHDAVGAEAEHLNVTFVRSTRDDRSAGGNAFTPAKVRLPGGKMDPRDRLAAVREAMGSRNQQTAGADLMGAVSGLANLLPTSVLTRIAVEQAAAVDFATSNIRAAPFDLYISGAKVLAPYPIGPVAATAWNITMMSYAGSLYMGVHIDPAAVEQPDLLMRCLREAFAELLDAAERPAPRRRSRQTRAQVPARQGAQADGEGRAR